jgi:hypothetical protein
MNILLQTTHGCRQGRLFAVPLNRLSLCLRRRRDRSQRRKRFFLKKEARTFANLCTRWIDANALVAKVFWFFFSKKNCLLWL